MISQNVIRPKIICSWLNTFLPCALSVNTLHYGACIMWYSIQCLLASGETDPNGKCSSLNFWNHSYPTSVWEGVSAFACKVLLNCLDSVSWMFNIHSLCRKTSCNMKVWGGLFILWMFFHVMLAKCF